VRTEDVKSKSQQIGLSWGVVVRCCSLAQVNFDLACGKSSGGFVARMLI
jgi:hypothetical protein